MISLIKSEWYRFSHMRSVVLFLIIGTIGITVIPFKDASSIGYNSMFDVSVTGYIALFCSVTALASFLMPVFVIFFIGYYEHKGYRSRVSNYGIISGYKNLHILMSKFIVEGVTVAISILIPVSLILLFLWQRNGLTDVVYQESYLFVQMLPLRLLLVFFDCLHIAIIVIMASRLFRSGVKGALFSFAWFFIKGYVSVFFLLGSGIHNAQYLIYGEPLVSIVNVLEGFEAKDNVTIFIIVMLSMVIDSVLFYTIIFVAEKIKEGKRRLV